VDQEKAVFDVELELAMISIKSKLDSSKSAVTNMLSRNDLTAALRNIKDVTDTLTQKAAEEKSNPKIAVLFDDTRAWLAINQPVCALHLSQAPFALYCNVNDMVLMSPYDDGIVGRGSSDYS
jgi:hypothetical protein